MFSFLYLHFSKYRIINVNQFKVYSISFLKSPSVVKYIFLIYYQRALCLIDATVYEE